MKFQEKLNSEACKDGRDFLRRNYAPVSQRGGLWRSWGPGARASPGTCRRRSDSESGVGVPRGGPGPEAGSRQRSHIWPGPGSKKPRLQSLSKAAGPRPAAMLGLWILRPQARPGRQKSGSGQAPSGRLLPHAARRPRNPCAPRPCSLTLSRSLSAQVVFQARAERMVLLLPTWLLGIG